MTHSIPNHKPLTEHEVSLLPNGSKILILWSGGNGPHEYIKGEDFYGYPIAWTIDKHIRHDLIFIGEYPLTQVWHIEEFK